MGPESLGLWMLFLCIQGGAGSKTDCGTYTGILGGAVELKCCYSGEDLKSTPFRVQWQLEHNDKCVVDAYVPNQRAPPPQCVIYKNRTLLKKDYLHLQLLNLSREDNNTYKCILQKIKNDQYQPIFFGLIRLEVAEIYSTYATKYPESPTPNSVTNDYQQQTQVVVLSCLAATFLLVIIIVLILCKRKRYLHSAHAPGGVDML